jgi:hypothetical protein
VRSAAYFRARCDVSTHDFLVESNEPTRPSSFLFARLIYSRHTSPSPYCYCSPAHADFADITISNAGLPSDRLERRTSGVLDLELNITLALGLRGSVSACISN